MDGDRQQARRLQEERHGKQFEVRFDGELATTPQRVWDAITTSNGTAGWIWPLEYEPPTDGSAPAIPDENGAVTVWEPAARFSARAEGPGGWFNNLDHVLEPTPGGTTLHYVHTGVFDEDGWDNLYDGCSQHTAFYMHTLGQYVRYFAGRTAAYAGIDAPAGSAAPDGFTRVREALGLPADVTAGTRVRLTPDGLAPIEGVVDYLHPNFLGIRTADAFYRFVGRNAFGAPVGITLHDFSSTRTWTAGKPGSTASTPPTQNL